MRDYKNILVVNPYGIGDVLFSSVVVRNLKTNFPSCKINMLLGSRTKEIYEDNPDVNNIIVFDKGGFDKSGFAKKLKMISVCLKELKKLRYDLMVDFSNAPEYGFTGKFLLKIPVRVGFDYKQRGRFLTDKIHIEGFSKKHIVEHYLDLLRKLEIPTPDEKLNFPVADKTIRWAKKFLDESGIKDSDLLIGISPGGGASWGRDANLKHWSQGNFSELAKLLIGEHRAKILLFGSYGEIELCKQVKDSINKKDVIDTSGRLDLKEFAALIKSCKVFICNDGGPLHIAKSQDASTVSIFGPVDSDVYGPYPRNNRDRIVEATLSCRPCYRNFKMSDCRRRDCFTNINPKEVFEEVSKLLG